MTFSPNPNWIAKTNAGALEPIYFVKFDGFNAFDFATAEIDFPMSAKKILLDNPSAVGQRLQQLTGRSSLSLISFGLVDRDGFITELISTEKVAPFLSTLVNRKVTLFGGYRGLRESDYEVIGVGQVASVDLPEGSTTYKIKMVDFKRNLAEDIMLNAKASSRRIAARFDGAVAVGATSFILNDIRNANEDDFLMLGPNSNGDEERVKIGFVDEFTRRVTLEAEPVQNVTQFAYADSDEVRWATTIVRGNPLNMIARFLTDSFSKTDPVELAFAALFPLTKTQGLPTGLGISPSQIDVPQLASERDLHLANEAWSFEFRSKTRGFRFLEQSIYRLLGYSHITIDGLISFKRYRPPTPKEILVDGLTTIKENDMIRWRWERAHDLHLNKVALGLDFDTDDGKVSQTIVTEDTFDQTDTAETKEIEIEDSGLRAPDGGARIGDRIGGELLRRYKKPPIQIKATVPLRLRAIEIGKDIEVSHELIPNIRTGFRGLLDQRLEVVERTDRIDKDEIDLVLQFNGMVRPGFWAPEIGEPREDGQVFGGAEINLNFTTAAGEAFAGYDNIGPSTTYPSTGHGEGGNITLGYLFGAGSGVDRDSVVSADERFDSMGITLDGAGQRFRIDLPNGLYQVRIVVGDPDAPRLKQTVFVFASGSPSVSFLDNVDIAAGQWIDVTREVVVLNGRLDIFLVVFTVDMVVINFSAMSIGAYDSATVKDQEYAHWGSESLDVFPDGKPLYEWV